jgi:hypothetical protein
MTIFITIFAHDKITTGIAYIKLEEASRKIIIGFN